MGYKFHDRSHSHLANCFNVYALSTVMLVVKECAAQSFALTVIVKYADFHCYVLKTSPHCTCTVGPTTFF